MTVSCVIEVISWPCCRSLLLMTAFKQLNSEERHHVCLHTDQKTYHLYVWKADKLRLQIETKTKAEV